MLKPRIDAKWKKLLLANYPVDTHLLDPYLPYGTEHALLDQKSYISLVGFLFLDVKLMGIKIPFHVNFVEVNLRFYVRRRFENEWRYGVVFIREFVALPMVSFIANTVARENYESVPMRHMMSSGKDTLTVEYSWQKEEWHSMQITAGSNSFPIPDASHMHFFTVQHWGYSKVNAHKAYEYSVEHPHWDMYSTREYCIDVDFGKSYGSKFAFLNNQQPESVFLAEGSGITMIKQKTIKIG